MRSFNDDASIEFLFQKDEQQSLETCLEKHQIQIHVISDVPYIYRLLREVLLLA